MVHRIGPRGQTGQTNGAVLDFARAALIRRITDKRKSLLSLSQVPPAGRANLITYPHNDVTFHVVAVERTVSAQAARKIEELYQEIEPASFIIEGTSEKVPEIAFARYVAEEGNIPIAQVIVSSSDKVVSDLVGIEDGDSVRAMVTDWAEFAQIDVPGVSTNRAQADIKLLREVAKDISWHRMQRLELEGQVIVLVSSDLAEIFDRDYQPKHRFSEEEILRVEKELRPKDSDKKLSDSEVDKMIRLALAFCEVTSYLRLLEEMENIDKDPANEIAQRRQETLLARFLDRYEKMDKLKKRAAAKDVFETGIKGGARIYRESLLEELREAEERGDFFIINRCVRILYENGLVEDLQTLKSYLDWLMEGKKYFRAFSMAKWIYREDDGNTEKLAYLKEVMRAYVESLIEEKQFGEACRIALQMIELEVEGSEEYLAKLMERIPLSELRKAPIYVREELEARGYDIPKPRKKKRKRRKA